MRTMISLSTPRLGRYVRLFGVRLKRMPLSGLIVRGQTRHGTVARCWYCNREAVAGEVCKWNPYTDHTFHYPHMVRVNILDRGRYVTGGDDMEFCCLDCGSELLTAEEREHEWCDTCWPGVLLGEEAYGAEVQSRDDSITGPGE